MKGHLKIKPTPAVAGEKLVLEGGLGPFPRMIVVQRRATNGAWVKVAQKKSNRLGEVTLTLSARSSTTAYRLYGDAFTFNGRRQPAAQSPVFTVKIAPQTATLEPLAAAATGDTRRAYVAFTPARKGRAIEFQRQVGSGWQTIGTSIQSALGKTSFAVDTSTAGSFTYRAVTLAADGAPAAVTPSRTLVVTGPDVTPPPVPATLSTTSGNNSIQVSWSPVVAPDLAGYRLVAATTENGTYVPLTGNLLTATTYLHSVPNGTTLWYKVASVDLLGNQSPYRGPVPGTAQDPFPPPVPTGLAAVPGNAQVHLTWNAVTAGDLAGYRVYRSLTGSEPWVELTTSPIAALQYDATGLANETTYHFAVTAEDLASNESARSASVSATPSAIDSTPPPVPVGVSATAADSAVEVSWSAVSAADLAGYRVYTGPSAAGPWTEATTDPVEELAFLVAGLQNGTAYWFAVSSVDEAGNESDKSSPASATPADQGEWSVLSAGLGHTCGVKTDGTLWCWGNNGSGQLGTGVISEDGEARPVQVGTGTDWATVDTGHSTTCALKADRTLWCFGGGDFGQLGLGAVTSQLTPAQLAVGTTWSSLAVGAQHACAVRSDGTLWCWGNNGNGQVGDDSTTHRDVPVQVGAVATWDTVDAGYSHSCGTRTGTTQAWCWGSNGSNELGNVTSGQAEIPTPLTEDGWQRLLPGNQYSCGLRTDDSLWCWGLPFSGQTGGLGSFATKAAVTPPSSWSSATPGEEHGCGIRLTGALWCWGRSDSGQVGDGQAHLNVAPVVIAAGTVWRSVTAGDMHTCGVHQDGTAWCWGHNGSGQLGTGDTETMLAPVPVDPPPEP